MKGLMNGCVMNEMVERVARAMAAELAQYEGEGKTFLPAAQVAIEAMRVPTEAILIAISDDMDNDQHPLVVWENAIDAALSE